MGKDKNQQQSVFGMKRPNAGIPGSQADWGGVDVSLIAKLISIATSRGGAVRFGYTRDGGAYAVGLYYGGDHTTEYIRPSEDISTRIMGFIGIYEDLPNSGGKSPE